MKKIILFRTRLSLLLFLLLLGSGQASILAQETDPLVPTSLFRARFPDGKDISLLGTQHNLPYEALPPAVRHHIEALAKQASNCGCQLITEADDQRDHSAMLADYLAELQYDAHQKGKDFASFTEWTDLWTEMFHFYIHPKAMKPFPHPWFVQKMYDAYESTLEEMVTKEEGMDEHIEDLFPFCDYALDKDEDFSVTSITPQDLRSYSLFEQSVSKVKKLWTQEKEKIVLRSSGDPRKNSKKHHFNFATNLTYFFQYNPFFDSEDLFRKAYGKDADIYVLSYRNQLWHERFAEVFPSLRRCLVIVGMAHLGGETGLLNFFHQHGASVSQYWVSSLPNRQGMVERTLDFSSPTLFQEISPETPSPLKKVAAYFLSMQLPDIYFIDLRDLEYIAAAKSLSQGVSFSITKHKGTYTGILTSEYTPLTEAEKAISFILTFPTAEENVYHCEVHSLTTEGILVAREPKLTFTLERQP